MSQLLLFLLGLLTDISWIQTILHSSKGNPKQAAVWTMVLTMIGVSSSWMVITEQDIVGAIFYTAGCGLGAYICVKWDIRHPKN